jgi:hypothetical protein
MAEHGRDIRGTRKIFDAFGTRARQHRDDYQRSLNSQLILGGISFADGSTGNG